MPAKIATIPELQLALIRQFPLWGLQGPCFMNGRYVVAARPWVEKQFSAYMWRFQQARGQLTWKKRGNQCEHFALRAVLEVIDLLSQMPEGEVPTDVESIAVAACK